MLDRRAVSAAINRLMLTKTNTGSKKRVASSKVLIRCLVTPLKISLRESLNVLSSVHAISRAAAFFFIHLKYFLNEAIQ